MVLPDVPATDRIGNGDDRMNETRAVVNTLETDLDALQTTVTALQSQVNNITPQIVADASATATDGVLLKGGSGGRINVSSPTSANNAANKTYVDSEIDSATSGLASQSSVSSLTTRVNRVEDGDLGSATWNRDVSGDTRRAVWMNSAAQLGHTASTRAVKRDIRPADLPASALRQIPVVLYRHVDADPARPLEIGTLAEDVHDLGLGAFVDYADDTGKPYSIHYHLLSLGALALAQHLADEVDALRARLDAIEGAGDE